MTLRNFQTDQQFSAIKSSASNAIKTVFPVRGKNRTILLDKVWVDDSASPRDYTAQAKAKAKEGTWGVPVYASLTLIDNKSKEVLDKKEKIRLFNLPKLTDRNSYVVKGNEYQVTNQLRLKPGAYTLRKQNGELKTQVNLAKGKNFELSFDEKRNLFLIEKIGGGQAKIPLYPILTHLGVSPTAIAKAWGGDLERANKSADQKVIKRAETAFNTKKSLKEYLDGTEINTDTTKRILGQEYSKVDGPMLLAASKNLLDVYLNKKDPVDRDSLEFKELLSVEDFIEEKIAGNAKDLAFKITRSLDNPNKNTLFKIVNPGSFNNIVESFFTQEDKSHTETQINPLEMMTGLYKTTIMGSGGLTSEHQVTADMRGIHPSHYGFIDPLHTPESDRVGVNLHLPMGAVKDGKKLETVLLDKKGKVVRLSPSEAYNKKVAFPDQKGKMAKVLHKGKLLNVPRSEVDYFTPRPEALFSPSTNLIPFLPAVQGNRATFASKQMEQAISLKHREAPLVQVGSSRGSTFEKDVARGRDPSKGGMLAVVAPDDGVIKNITKEKISISTKSGVKHLNLYENFSLNRKSYLHHTPLVKVGDKVKKGQVLADNNFTKDGVLALGTNMRAAYLPYKGLNFEDGIVITESASEKLTSQHIHKKSLSLHENIDTTLGFYTAVYPNVLTPDNYRKLGNDGVVKKGAKIVKGDHIIVALQKRDPSKQIGVVSKVLSERPKDVSVVWTFDDGGEVIDVQKSKAKIVVSVKTEEKARIGDKLAGRAGNKGIITKIIPDKDAPKNSDGTPVDVLLNPHGVVSRINIGQIYESAAAKAAKKSGKPFVINNFTGENYLKSTKDFLKKNKVEDKEELFDAKSGKSLGRVHVGNPYILKLDKQGQHNYSVREGGAGHPYDMLLQPAKPGGEKNAKALDLLTMYSMLSHGARANLREMATVKSTRNDEFWKALKSGQSLPPPETTHAYNRFMGYLRGAGIDVKKEGSQLTLAPLTDEQVKAQSKMNVKSPFFYQAKNMKPIKGGFLDEAKLGGFQGENWSHYELKEPVVNPIFEKAITKVTGLREKTFQDIMAGKAHVGKDGKVNKKGVGTTGGEAIKQLLDKIDVNDQIKVLTKEGLKAKGNKLDDINKKLRYLKALKDLKLKPSEAYMRKLVPVVPPKYRPIYPLPDGNMGTSDVNVLYQNTAVLNEMMKQPVMDLLPDDEKADIRKDLYSHVKGVSGLTTLNLKGRDRKGFISEIAGGGKSPKEGYFISKLLSKKQDFAGRGTIIPEPDLGIDEMAMPEEMAWKIFSPFVVKELRKFGKKPLQAQEEIKQRTPLARAALDQVMKDRKVLLNRAPSLHKFSVMGFKPTITNGRAIKIPPLVVKGFNADFDGDTMTVHTPITDDANREAEKLMPSRNLFQPGSGKLMIAPSQEALIGLYYLSKDKTGQAKLNKILNKSGFKVDEVLNKGAMNKLLTKVAKKVDPNEFARIVAELKKAGEDHAYDRGFTLGLEDIPTITQGRDQFIKATAKRAKAAKTPEQLAKINSEGNAFIDKLISKKLKNKNNPLFDMVDSGARGSSSQLRSMLTTPFLVADTKGKTVPIPIKKSYAEGLDIDDYWVSTYGARKGMMDRAVQTSVPGAFSKGIMASVIDNVISSEDCKTKDGTRLDIKSKDLHGRYLAGNQGGALHDTLVDQSIINKLKKARLKTVKVRSPLTCEQAKGTCAKCFGLNENDKLPDLGDNIGATAGQTLSEPLTQMTMNTFHTGGVAGTGTDVGGYARIDQLLKMPKIVAGAAPLAPLDGIITNIKKGAAGGYEVYINQKKVVVPFGRKLKVKKGQAVKKGDPLSTGTIKPQDLVKLKGMGAAQEYLTSELQNAYANQGVHIQRKTFETIVRSLGNTTQVVNNPRDVGFVPGDVISYNVARAHNKNLETTKKVEDAVGYKLAQDYGTLKKGHTLTDKNVLFLKGTGTEQVKVVKDAIVHTPVLKGMNSLPLLRKDWMAALGYQNLAKALTQGAGQSWTTDLEGHHPIPAFAHGATFGKGKDGKY